MSNLKYLTPQKPITAIVRERAEQAEKQNVDLYEAVAGLYEELGAANGQIAALKDRVAKIEKGGK